MILSKESIFKFLANCQYAVKLQYLKYYKYRNINKIIFNTFTMQITSYFTNKKKSNCSSRSKNNCTYS